MTLVELVLAVLARAVPELDVDAVERLLIARRGPTMYPRVTCLRRLLRDAAAG